MASTTVESDGIGNTLSSTASTTIELHPTGPNALGVDTQTHPGNSDYAMTIADRTIATSEALVGSWVWTLPAAVSVPKGWEIVVSDHFGTCTLAYRITVNMTGTDTINGSADYAKEIVSPYGFFRFRSDGTANWQIVGAFPMTGTPIGDSDYQMLATDTYVYTTVDLTAGRIWTLPDANSVATGWLISVADSAGGIQASATDTLSVAAGGTDSMNGVLNAGNTMYYPFAFATYQSDGVSNWQIMAGSLTNAQAGTEDALIENLSVQGALVVPYSTLTMTNGRNDNVALQASGSTNVLLNGATAVYSISGIVPTTSFLVTAPDGQTVQLRNNVAYALTLLHQNTNSTTANRIYSPTGADVVVASGGTATLIYSTATSRWWIANVYDGTGGPLTITESQVTNLVSDLALKAPLASPTFTGTVTLPTGASITAPTGLVKGDVGLGNVDNTSDATKNAAAVTLTNKTITSPAITTPTGIVKGDVGLGNVDNTSNATERAASATLTNKTLTSPVLNTGVSGTAVDTDSTMAANSDTLIASQKAIKTALALKAPLASPTFTSVPAAPTAAQGTSTTQLATTAFVLTNYGTVLATQSYAPATLTSWTIAATTLTALDTTNASISFTVPANGIVDIQVSYYAQTAQTATVNTLWTGLLNHSGGARVGNATLAQDTTATSTVVHGTVHSVFHLTGLTPGALQLDFAAGRTNATGCTSTIYASKADSLTVATLAASFTGPFVMRAIASV